MTRYLLDTNHLSALLNAEAEVRQTLLDLKGTILYGHLYHELRRRGRALSQVDIMLAALARQMDAALVSTDRDFEAVPGIQTESWLPR